MFGDCTRRAKIKKEVHTMITLIKGKVYIADATHNELRDNEANLPGVPPDACYNSILPRNTTFSHIEKG